MESRIPYLNTKSPKSYHMYSEKKSRENCEVFFSLLFSIVDTDPFPIFRSIWNTLGGGDDTRLYSP